MTRTLELLSLSSSIYGVKASNIKHELLDEVLIPQQIRDEIPTLNKFGYMKVELDEFSKDFIHYAAELSIPVLEIGCAYGYVVKEVLRMGGSVIANDIDENHLATVIKTTPAAELEKLYIYLGGFPDKIDFPQESLGGVMASRVMHFLSSNEIEKGLKKVQNWLVPGGKLFFTALSPWNYTLRDEFLSIYEKRRVQGDKWPGKVEEMKKYAREHAPYIPDFLQVFDIPQLEELLPQYGFEIEKIKLFDYANQDSDDKGHIGFVAVKV